MLRIVFALVCLVGCAADAPESVEFVESAEPAAVQAGPAALRRERVTDDVYHYELVLPIGSAPNAALRLHRVVREIAPGVPRRTTHAAMLLHGDFSTFLTNFAPGLATPASPVSGLAPYLAVRDLDVWGLDRRWAVAAAGADVSDFGAMGVAQELDDLALALAFARAARLLGGDGGKLALVGFSHGAELAYLYASREAAQPPALRHVGAVVPIDFYGALGPDQRDARAALCESAALQYAAVAAGVTDAPNDFFIELARLARTAPDAPSPLFGPPFTNRAAFLRVAAQTYALGVPYAPRYHLLAPLLDGDAAVGLREVSDAAALAWLEGATPHQSMREAADLDAVLCGAAPPIDAPLARIRVPLYYLGAAGGVGTLGVYSTTQVRSTDVTTHVVRRFTADAAAADFGHGDLLFAADAPALAWSPLAAWLAAH